MASGGARARSGPAPDPDALRRERDGDSWVTLPREGRQDPAPEWPLTPPTDRETELWAAEWTRPQAIMWERNGQEIEVALYVRTLTKAEAKDAATNVRTLLRQQQEALGLSIPGLHRNKWRIEGGETASRQEVAPSTGPSARDRFKVVDGGRK